MTCVISYAKTYISAQSARCHAISKIERILDAMVEILWANNAIDYPFSLYRTFHSTQEIEEFLMRIKQIYNEENISKMMEESGVFGKHTAADKEEALNISLTRFAEDPKVPANSVLIGKKDKDFLIQTLTNLLYSSAVAIAIESTSKSGSRTIDYSIPYMLPLNHQSQYFFIKPLDQRGEMKKWKKLDVVLTIGSSKVIIKHCQPE